ncbi:MAG TPA: alkaline phosphatase family protein [Bryobacteraceae bacterium]|nr:alkaline phosphatase family protein [Bryobacteraceae bacterium]HUO31637.1 alkaline phosphatase family protein [Bryobacteraceae bacterium]
MAPQPRQSQRVVLIGWDAADWNLLNPLIDAGLMPNLRGLIERGAMGKMATMQPPLSPLLWTTAVTGMKPDRHGILGFLEPDPITGGVRSITSTTRKVKAVWNILHQAGLSSVVVNWFAGHPAEKIRGAVVSDAYPKLTGPHGAPWPVIPGSIFPASLEGTLAELRVHPGDLTGDDLALFIPELERIDQTKDSRPTTLASILAENISTHAAATWLMENQEWDFLAVFYDLIDHAAHKFMPFHPPAMTGVRAEDAEIYKDVINGVCRYSDLMLGRLLHLAGPDSTVILMSDHGIQTGHLRPAARAEFRPESPMQLHRSHGILCLAGPDIRRDELVYGAELADITPTILSIFGLPVGMDMQGRVLAEAFETPVDAGTIPSWEQVAGECGRDVPEEPQEFDASMLVLQRLADLGYIDQPSEDARKMVRVVKNHNSFNLARVYMAAGRPADALPLFEGLAEDAPEELAFRLHLAQCYYELGRPDDCRATAQAVLDHDRNRPAGALILANLCLADGRVEEGLNLLLEAEKCSRPAPAVRHLIARVYLRQKRFEDAERAFRSVIALDPDHAAARAGLAQALLEQNKSKDAADAAMDAVRLQFDLPAAHFTLGAALARIGLVPRAIQAFETCLALRPDTPAAQRWLEMLHKRVKKNAGRVSQRRRAMAGGI